MVGNQRGNYVDAARHFMNAEDNEHVEVHQIRGFMGNDLFSAFQESYAVSLGTKAKQHLYSLSLSPPKGARVSDEEFEAAVDRAEKRLGLTGQPRVIVFHEKRGRDGELRRHAHAIFCRVDAEIGKAIQMSYDRSKLFDLSHELFLENGWELPQGYERKQDRSPLNYTHAEHQQARRRGKYADDIKRFFQNAWERSDTIETFSAALKEQGYVLAKGGHAAFVTVDAEGEVYSIARCLPINTKEIRARLGEPDHLPSVEQAQEIAASLERPEVQQRSQKPDVSESPAERRIRRDPEHILSIINEKESTFTRHDIAKALNSYIDDPVGYQAAYQTVLSSDKLVRLTPEVDGAQIKARYSTREMVDLESRLMRDAQTMAGTRAFGLPKRHVEHAIQMTDNALRNEAGVELGVEQRTAIRHLTSNEQLSCVIGVAGAGKSTILAAAREAWEANGHRVFGAALAGKAAKGLEQSSGIKSRTLASFELSWQNEVNQLRQGDVLVIDEAGMVGSKQLARFITEAKDKGAKLVLVGDAEQLQPINAGAPFRNITEEIKPATLHDVHRQLRDWQKQASKDFALGNTQDALTAYLDRECTEVMESNEDAIAALSGDYLNAFWSSNKRSSQIALAHRKADVKSINQSIRQARKEAGELEDGVSYRTAHGRREFASGDRLLFTRNDRDLDVKNGMLGTVTSVDGQRLTIMLDDKDGAEAVTRTFSANEYADFEHGYATTIHKSQGCTVDQSYVLASRTMDRHLTYVAMTRHRQDTKLYVSEDEFSNYGSLTTALCRKRQKQSSLDFNQQGTRHYEQRRQERLSYLQRMSGGFAERVDRDLERDRDGPDLGL